MHSAPETPQWYWRRRALIYVVLVAVAVTFSTYDIAWQKSHGAAIFEPSLLLGMPTSLLVGAIVEGIQSTGPYRPLGTVGRILLATGPAVFQAMVVWALAHVADRKHVR